VCCCCLVLNGHLVFRQEKKQQKKSERAAAKKAKKEMKKLGLLPNDRKKTLFELEQDRQRKRTRAPSSHSGLSFTPKLLTRNPHTSVLADAALPLPGPRHERQGRRTEEVQLSPPLALRHSTPPKP
jgi:hypothetical protein